MSRLYSRIVNTVTTYEVEDGFNLIIVRKPATTNFEVWLTHNSIGIADFLFGGNQDLTDEDLIDLFDANAEEYMSTFYAEYDD